MCDNGVPLVDRISILNEQEEKVKGGAKADDAYRGQDSLIESLEQAYAV